MKNKKMMLIAGIAIVVAAAYLYKRSNDKKKVEGAKQDALAGNAGTPATATPGILPNETILVKPVNEVV